MEQSENLSKNSSLRLKTQQSFHRLGLCSQMTNVQQTSPIVFPEKRGNNRGNLSSARADVSGNNNETKGAELRIDIVDEQSDLLGHEVFKGKLFLDKRRFTNNSEIKASEYKDSDFVDAKLTTKTLIWDSHILQLDHVVSLSYSAGLRHFTVHAYPLKKVSCALFTKSGRSRKDFRFIASTSEDAIRWVNAFADQRLFVNCLPCPSASKLRSDSIFSEFPTETCIKCKIPPKMLVILNPRSGHGRSSKVFHGFVEPIFKLAGFQLEVVKTTSAGHARKLAASVDFSTCPDGIICVGGDGIINEVLNGLLNRDNQKEAMSVPIGIIPAGSDNSLVWTVLGVRDPISAAITIVKGGLTAIDVFALEWIRTGAIHFGMIVTYFGFVSDVLELSEKYQRRFGPLRYFIAGFLKFLCLPKYSYEVEYIPSRSKPADSKLSTDQQKTIDMSELYIDIMRRSSKEGLPRASSMSSIESIITPSQTSAADLDSTEPSDCVRAIDPKSKRLSQERTNPAWEPEEVISHSVTPNWTRSRSKSRTDKGWAGLTLSNVDDPTRPSRVVGDREEISSTVSDPGQIWDGEPKWDADPSWDPEDPVELPGPREDPETGPKPESNNWVVKKGQFLGVLICNHSCKTVQSSQVVAPEAEHDDGNLDLLMVHGSGRLRLLRFFVLLQMGKHLTLPYVEYVKVKQVKVRAGKNTHNGCGIDGELFPLNGPVICSLLPERCKLIGHSSCSRS